MTTPRKPSRVMVVSAKNKRHGGKETRRWTENITRDDAIAQMGYWLTQLGWHYKEIMITSADVQIEDTT
ncbi:MAG: hypothetical protein LC723_06390, partial [Actinobacteria bacterium]|nr:hypothetical protein [Actinomycetota bacterium]